MGIEHVGIGTDGFNHPRKMYDLTAALVRRGSTWTDGQNKTGEKS